METTKQNEEPFQERAFLIVVVLASLLIGYCYALLVKPGTPHDEPSHFTNVQYYANHLRLPFLGESDATYEGYMGPVYYALAALIYKIANFGNARAGFYTLRFADLLLMIPAILLTNALCQRLWNNRAITRLATLFVALNPVLIGLAASIQNDMLGIIEFLGLSYLTLHWLSKRPPTVRVAVSLGFLVGIAILTKLTVVILLFSIPLYAIAMHRRQALVFVSFFAATVALTSGWWFIRNLALYGDLTGVRGLRIYAPGALGNPMPIYRPSEFFQWTRVILTYYWLPVEYYRNEIKASIAQRLFVIVFTLLGALGWMKQFRHHTLNGDKIVGTYLALQYAGAIAIYAYITLRVFYYPARNIMPTLALYSMALSFGLWRLFGNETEKRRKQVMAVLVGALLLTNLQTLKGVNRIPARSYNLFSPLSQPVDGPRPKQGTTDERLPPR